MCNCKKVSVNQQNEKDKRFTAVILVKSLPRLAYIMHKLG